jgi:phage terminase large subunit
VGSLQVKVARAYLPLLKPARYKGAHGGRGSGKSHFFAEQVILRMYAGKTRVACIREIQNTLKDSVKQLLTDKIQLFGLGGMFEVLESEIRGPNGSLAIFRGMQSYNAESIKSLEGFDLVWVEEAQTLSDHSLRMLRPTIRKDGSELWFSWNPRHDTDAVDKLLRSTTKPANAIVCEVNWDDNPWFPAVLKEEMFGDYAADPEMAEHVWGGGYMLVSEGAYYARLLLDAEREGRIGDFPPPPGVKIKTAWDLGVDDYTAVWFLYDDGFKCTVVDYYESSGDGADDVLAYCMPEIFIPPPENARWDGWDKDEALLRLDRDPPFVYGDSYLPHDIKVREWGAGARSRVESLSRFGLKKILKGVASKTADADRIAAVRRILPITRFHKTPRVEAGIKRLRRFRRKYNDALQTYTTPLDDDNVHAADAFGEYAVNCGIYAPKEPAPPAKVTTRKPTLDEVVAEHDRSQRYIGNRI